MHFQTVSLSSLFFATVLGAAVPQGNVAVVNKEYIFGCTRSQKKEIVADINDAKTLVEGAVAGTSSPNGQAFVTFIDGNSQTAPNNAKILSDRFTQMKELLSAPSDKLKIRCRGTEDKTCALNSKPQAYFDMKTKETILCTTGYFDPAMKKLSDMVSKCDGARDHIILMRSRAATIIHQLTHYDTVIKASISTTDDIRNCQVGPAFSRYFAKTNPRLAIMNADNYGWFATANYLNTRCPGAEWTQTFGKTDVYARGTMIGKDEVCKKVFGQMTVPILQSMTREDYLASQKEPLSVKMNAPHFDQGM